MNPFEGHSAGWFGDHGSVHGGDWDDEYGTWNRNWCDKNNDGATAHANNVKPYRCCRSGALSTGRTAVCPNQLTAMSTQNGEICASGFQSQTNIHTAFDRCRGMKGHVCLHNDMQQLCGGGNPFQGWSQGWFGDHGTASGGNWDDEFGTWDNQVCNGDNDGKAYHSHTSNTYRCCAASTAVQEHGTTITKECDAGFTRYGGLCWMNPNVRKNAHDAIEHCRGLKAHMCEHVEMQTVCAHGKNPYGDSQGWYGDHGKRGSSWDDHYGSWNHGNCAGNNDGPAYSSGHSFTFRCCKRAFIPIRHVQPNPQNPQACGGTLVDHTGKTVKAVAVSVDTNDCSMVFTSSSRLIVGDPLSTSGDFTIEAMVNMDSNGDGYDIFFDTGAYRFGYYQNSLYIWKMNYIVKSSFSRDGQWSHAALRYDHNAKQIWLCTDGVCDGPHSVSPSQPPTAEALIGSGNDGFGSGFRPEGSRVHHFHGKMKYIRQWSAKLSDSDLASLAAGNAVSSQSIHIDVSALA